ncbi:hypothetical protein DRZ77_00020 [Candidatus Woesearchaeota archaeon]|nr:hypothetical protein [Candidatus Woesearchaeota archaeon]RLE41121.1 MAG: hypothetical protein DRZ77_00020 [Candidatus Woesearchaeota archaeon]
MINKIDKIVAYFSELLDYFRALLILTDKYIEEYKTISPQLILRYSKKLTKGKIRLSSATSKALSEIERISLKIRKISRKLSKAISKEEKILLAEKHRGFISVLEEIKKIYSLDFKLLQDELKDIERSNAWERVKELYEYRDLIIKIISTIKEAIEKTKRIKRIVSAEAMLSDMESFRNEFPKLAAIFESGKREIRLKERECRKLIKIIRNALSKYFTKGLFIIVRGPEVHPINKREEKHWNIKGTYFKKRKINIHLIAA